MKKKKRKIPRSDCEKLLELSDELTRLDNRKNEIYRIARKIIGFANCDLHYLDIEFQDDMEEWDGVCPRLVFYAEAARRRWEREEMTDEEREHARRELKSALR